MQIMHWVLFPAGFQNPKQKPETMEKHGEKQDFGENADEQQVLCNLFDCLRCPTNF